MGRKNRLVELYHTYGAGFGDERASRLTRTLSRTGGVISTLIFTTAALGPMVGAIMVGAPLMIPLVIGIFVLVGVLTLVGFRRQPATSTEANQGKHKRPKSARN